MPEQLDRAALQTMFQQESQSLQALLPRFSDEQWRNTTRSDGWTAHDIVAHIADSSYGLALMTLGEITPPLPLNPETGWMDVDDYNVERRAKNANLPREKVVSRLHSALDQVQRAVETTDDLDAPGPFGPIHTKGFWLTRMVYHVRMHRRDLEELFSSASQ